MEKIQPHDLESERSLLGSILINPDCYTKIMTVVSTESFYKSAHKYIFKAIQDLIRDDVEVDIITVSNRLNENKQLEQIGGRAYVNDIALSSISSACVESYAKIVNDKHILRKFIKLGNELQALSFDNYDRNELINFANNQLSLIANLNCEKEGKDLSEILYNRYSEISEVFEDVQNGKPLEIKGAIKTGNEIFDKYMRGGFKGGELTIIAARSRIGKTAFEIYLENCISGSNDVAIADFQMETPEQELADRHLSNMTGIKKGYFTYVNNLNEDMFKCLTKSLNLDKSPIKVFQNPDFNVLEIEAKARQFFCNVNKQGLIFIDNLQLIVDVHKGKDDIAITTNITKDCKKLAQRLNVPVILLAQLVKEAEDNKPPTLKEIRGSGQIIANSDQIILLHVDTKESEGLDFVDLDVNFAKVRRGQEGIIKHKFDKSTNRFYEQKQG